MARWALLEVSVYENTIRRRWRPPGASWIFNESTGFPYRLEYRTTTGRLIRREKRFYCLRVAEQAAEEIARYCDVAKVTICDAVPGRT